VPDAIKVTNQVRSVTFIRSYFINHVYSSGARTLKTSKETYLLSVAYAATLVLYTQPLSWPVSMKSPSFKLPLEINWSNLTSCLKLELYIRGQNFETGFVVLTAVAMNVAISCEITPYSPYVNRRFGGMYHYHPEDDRFI
jgi:hypothetical protein